MKAYFDTVIAPLNVDLGNSLGITQIAVRDDSVDLEALIKRADTIEIKFYTEGELYHLDESAAWADDQRYERPEAV